MTSLLYDVEETLKGGAGWWWRGGGKRRREEEKGRKGSGTDGGTMRLHNNNVKVLYVFFSLSEERRQVEEWKLGS